MHVFHQIFYEFDQQICSVSLVFQGTAAIEGIYLDMSKIKKLNLSPAVFSKMYNLRLLKFYNSELFLIGKSNVCLPRDLRSLPDALRYLYWDGYPSKCLPPKFCPHNLVELEMPRSQVERLWHNIQVPRRII